ncbi:signal transduction histidine kinase sporulation regulator spoob [Lucifera butyrica]|uniref:Signal transduction histidine kinase sporulation regulator spoob n=1 Tax=Lucifera butyrica TaxID=1351585 RepID=A0A498RFK5_9FIRM|nr:Spo0B domain-containing protein [Lucifera butyrica]VBB07878.1 signal transduction histidine kinase sporulation regulator spoob [Lucifera butyrica]
MANTDVCDELVRLLRIQRHDFINHMQVIHAMIQLGKTDRAMKYIEELARDPDLMSDVIDKHTIQEHCRKVGS